MVKNIIIVVLVIIIVVLGYMLMVSFPKKAEAECTAKCTETVQTQVASAVQECMAGAEDCQQMLQQLMQVPACAEALSQ
jgi:Tfp pilus assembly protein PilO